MVDCSLISISRVSIHRRATEETNRSKRFCKQIEVSALGVTESNYVTAGKMGSHLQGSTSPH